MRLQTDGLYEEKRSRRNVNSKSVFVGDIGALWDSIPSINCYELWLYRLIYIIFFLCYAVRSIFREEYRYRRRLAKQNGRFEAIGAAGDTEHDDDDDETTEGPMNDGSTDEVSDDVDFHDIARSNADAGLIDVASTTVSQCPVENGVVRTTWGAIAAGPLITGIAAGLVQQSVTTRELISLTRSRADGLHQSRQQTLSVDNRWASTLSGDLAEVALLQGPLTNDIRVGAAGAWNSTQLPHWYFLSQRERLVTINTNKFVLQKTQYLLNKNCKM